MPSLWGAMLRRWLDPGGEPRLDRLPDHLLRDAGLAEATPLHTGYSCDPNPEPFGRSDFFNLASLTLNGDTGSAGIPASFNLRRSSMKLVVPTYRPTNWQRRTGDCQMRAIPRLSHRPAAVLPLAEREFRISRGSYECLSGLLRP